MGDLVGIPVRVVPEDPLDALMTLITVPSVGARLCTASAAAGISVRATHLPLEMSNFTAEEVAAFTVGRMISSSPPKGAKVPVVVSFLNPDGVLRPEDQGNLVNLACNRVSLVNAGDVGEVHAAASTLPPGTYVYVVW
jgi:hypothetical protein